VSFITKRPIISSCGLCGALEMVTGDLKINDIRDAVAVGFLMGKASGYMPPICNACAEETDKLVKSARRKMTD
jgi:hypothetical protein